MGPVPVGPATAAGSRHARGRGGADGSGKGSQQPVSPPRTGVRNSGESPWRGSHLALEGSEIGQIGADATFVGSAAKGFKRKSYGGCLPGFRAHGTFHRRPKCNKLQVLGDAASKPLAGSSLARCATRQTLRVASTGPARLPADRSAESVSPSIQGPRPPTLQGSPRDSATCFDARRWHR